MSSASSLLTYKARDSHLAIGGSSGTPFETIVSDLDLFLIGLDDDTALAIRREIGQLCGRSVDLEHMKAARFFELTNELRCYRPQLSAGLSPFSFGELRFLVRACQGSPIFSDNAIGNRLEEIREPLRIASAFYLSSLFVMRYQDAYGLFSANRIEDLTLVSGELIQLACLLALLQGDLVDLAPKSAPRRAILFGKGGLDVLASRTIEHFRSADHANERDWALNLLYFVNAVIAAGTLAGRVAALHSVGSDWAAEYCLMGVPGYLSAINVVTNRIALVNEAYLRALAADRFRQKIEGCFR